MLNLGNRVKETSTTEGTGTLTLLGPASSKYSSFVDAITDAMGGSSPWARVPYFIWEGTDWETGLGTVTDAAQDTLARTILVASSTGSKIDWGPGTRDVILIIPAEYVADHSGVQDGVAVYAVDSGAVNAYALTLSPPVGAYAAGQVFRFVPANTNTTDAATLNVNGLGAKAIKTQAGSDPGVGRINTSGFLTVGYDGTNFVILSASEFASGIELVFGAAVDTGWTQTADNDRVLRVVSGAGGGTGGSVSIAGGVVASAGVSLSVSQLPVHNHPVSTQTSGFQGGGSGTAHDTGGASGIKNPTSANAGSGTSHTHNVTYNPLYQDVTIAAKN